MKAAAVKVRIFCRKCSKVTDARNGPTRKGRGWIWTNTCSGCGTVTTTVSRGRRKQADLERRGQGRLF